jgi:hypothetical protein
MDSSDLVLRLISFDLQLAHVLGKAEQKPKGF